MLSVILFALTAVFAVAYYLSKRKFDYWKKRNVKFVEPTPLLGNYGDFILLKRHIAYVVDEMCDKFPNEPYIGAFLGTEPTLIVKDPELLKLVMTKEFYYFSSRETFEYNHLEPFNLGLFTAHGDTWKAVRQSLTPVFTSAKMKNMFHLIEKCAHGLEAVLEREVKDSIEVRALIARFTMSSIIYCGFGMDSDTLSEGYEKNPFTKVANIFFSGSRYFAAKNIFKSIWPHIFYGMGFKVAPKPFIDFFRKLMRNVFEARNFKPTDRNDFIDFLLNFQQKSHITGDSLSNTKTGLDKKVQLPITEDLLMAQVALFFLAGFETSATTSSFTLLELAKHPDIQKKVQEEIDAYLQKYDNKLTYEVTSELPYTYACVEETLRHYPVLTTLTREVIEDFTLPTGVHLEKGTRVHLPVTHMHMNPKYWSDPKVYRPERFLGEERNKIVPYSYMPFGEGARICIGKRFAKMQVLAGLVTILKKYDIELAENTAAEPKLDPLNLLPIPRDPLKLNVTARKGWENRRFAKA